MHINYSFAKLFYFPKQKRILQLLIFQIFVIAMERKRNNGFWQRWRHKYRLVILSADNFEERLSFMLSRLNIFVFSSFVLLFLIGGTCLLIALTPIREYIPGYTSSNMRRDVVELNRLSDSLLVVSWKVKIVTYKISATLYKGHMQQKTQTLYSAKRSFS